MKKTPLILLVGFLGAGKTTFLQALAPALAAEGLEPSLLINDYQNARIDAERPRGLSTDIATLNGDGVCCNSRDELLETLEKFEYRHGHALLLETKPPPILIQTPRIPRPRFPRVNSALRPLPSNPIDQIAFPRVRAL
jgi:G3E family GTPase